MSGHGRRSIALVPALALVAACGTVDDDATAPSTTVRVLAAASLTEAFTDLGHAFEAAHEGTKVELSFASSSALAQQIDDGGPADVFASADEANMRKVVDAGNATDAEVIARNRLAILVEKGNPKGVSGLADLAQRDVVLVLCAPAVPCGKYAAAALEKAGVTVNPASLEENVKAAASKVTLGEADAGIVYATDVKAAGDEAEGVVIDIADDPELLATYLMAKTTSASSDAADAWMDFVRSDEGQHVLAARGFLSP